MKYLINKEIDDYIREIFAWTFEHNTVSLWLLFIPIVLWIVLGLFYILSKMVDWEDDSWIVVIGKTGAYVFTPIAYLIVTGYIGYFYYS